MFNKQEKPIELSQEELTQQMQKLQAKLEQTTKELQKLKKQIQSAVTKVGITRFNPFGEMGGDQSFAIALLNEEDNGIVVTSYYGKELNRIFAKPIQQGKSKYELADEEKEAIAQAMGVSPKNNQ